MSNSKQNYDYNIIFISKILQTIPVSAALWNSKLEIIDCNKGLLDMLNIKNKGELLADLFVYLPKYQADGVKSQITFKKLLSSALNSQKAAIQMEFLNTQKKQISTLVQAYGIEFDKHTFIITYIEDITALKRTEEKIDILKNMAYKDSLTGAFTRPYFIQKANEILSDNKLKYKHNAVIMLDIDNLKSINDENRHEAGDVALRNTMHVIKSIIRSNDIIARYGGDEFLVLLTNVSYSEIQKITERIRSNIEKTIIKYDNKELYITVSMGVAIQDDKNNDINKLIKDADEKLYLAKKSGKNTIII